MTLHEVIWMLLEGITRWPVSPLFSAGPFPAVAYTITPISGGSVVETQLEVRLMGDDFDELLKVRDQVSDLLDMEAQTPSLRFKNYVIRSQLSGGGELFNDGPQLYEVLATYQLTWRLKPMNEKDEIILGAGEVFMYEFDGSALPEDAEIETTEHNVGHCSGGFSIDYKPEKYDVKNQYGTIVRSYIIGEEITAKTGILSWYLKNLALLSTAAFSEDKADKKRKLVFGGKNPKLKTVLFRFVHEKENGKKLRFTMIGQGGAGFAVEFTTKELSVDAQITAVEAIKGFLAQIDEELTEEEAAALPEPTPAS